MSDGSEFDTELESILDVDVSDIQGAEFGEALPKLFGIFDVTSAELKPWEKDGERKGYMVTFGFELKGVKQLFDKKDPHTGQQISEESLIGRKHFETMTFKTSDDSIKYVVGRIEKLGGQKGKLKAALDSCVGNTIAAVIIKQRNANDPDRPYTKMDKIKKI